MDGLPADGEGPEPVTNQDDGGDLMHREAERDELRR